MMHFNTIALFIRLLGMINNLGQLKVASIFELAEMPWKLLIHKDFSINYRQI